MQQPDVVAPGYYTYSAKASGSTAATCETVSMAGTSMATPAASGAAATVRQYFLDTNFWGTMCNSSYSKCGSFNPKGATVKAMLINSGHPMADYGGNSETVEPAASLSSPPDFYQGYGRIALQNVLPYTGIEEVTDLFVDELIVPSMTKFTYTVTVTDVTRPVKATIVWMDPTNSDITAKMLLHDLDLIVTDPSGSKYYGNGKAKDEVNNVEQVSISNPALGAYTVEVIGKTFWESSTQAVSLVVTSGGSVSAPTSASVDDNEAYFQMTCGSNEIMLSVRKLDSEGDGWNGGSYSIVNGTGAIVHTSTMGTAIPSDILEMDYLCVNKEETYTVEYSGGSGGWGVEIDECMIYMSDSSTASQTLYFDSQSSCNTCTDYSLHLLLVGSFYGIPYGWKDSSMYNLVNVLNESSVQAGTLATGMTSEHIYCLAEGTYKLDFKSIPSSDDALDDDYLANYFGVEEYQIQVDNQEVINPSKYALITISGSTASVSVFADTEDDDHDDNDDDDFITGGGGDTSLSSGGIAGIAVATVVGLVGLNLGAEYLASVSSGADDDDGAPDDYVPLGDASYTQ